MTSQYTAGTVTVTYGSSTVTGSGTLWASSVNVNDLFGIPGIPLLYNVGSVVSDTQITLTAPYSGASGSGLPYAISRWFTPTLGLPLIPYGAKGSDALISKAFTTIDTITSNIDSLIYPENSGSSPIFEHDVGVSVQPYDGDLAALAALDSTAGLLTKTADNTYTRRTLSAPAAGFTITNPAGTAGNPTFALADDLSAVEGLTGTGIVSRTNTNSWAATSLSAHGVVIAQGSAAPTAATVGTAGRIMVDQGASADPAFVVVSGDAALSSAGALTVANNAITNAKAAAMAAYTVKANNTSASANQADVTLSSIKDMINGVGAGGIPLFSHDVGTSVQPFSIYLQQANGWSDLVGNINVKGSGANDPAWTAFISGIYQFSFSATVMKEVWVNYHVDHAYAAGTAIYLHAHWSTSGTNTGVVRWGFEYTVMKGHQQGAFPATTTVYKEQAAQGTAYYHMIAEVAIGDAIPATNLEPDSLILVRIFRDASHANDTCTDAAFLLTADCHYQVDRLSTKNKSPNFYA